MNKITGEQVKKAMIDNNIDRVDHHDCGGCGAMVYYYREDEYLFFNSNCGCSSFRTVPKREDWRDAANWINMQTNEDVRKDLMKRFGLL